MIVIIYDTLIVISVTLIMLYIGADINVQFIEHKKLLLDLKSAILQLKFNRV